MFTNNITQIYNYLNESFEILIMLIGSFFLGLFTCWLLGKSTSKQTKPRNNNFQDRDQLTDTNYNQYSPSTNKNSNYSSSKVYSNTKKSDFSIIKGITPDIARQLNTNHIINYEDLRDINNKTLSNITRKLSSIHNSTDKIAKTWPHQAALACNKDWKKLSEYQDYLEQTIFPAKEMTLGKKKSDNLQKIKGIGPQIEKLLNQKGISTYKQLRESDASELKEYLSNADQRFKNNQTSTWPHQANIAAKGKWNELKTYQEFMNDINIDTDNLIATVQRPKVAKNRPQKPKYNDENIISITSPSKKTKDNLQKITGINPDTEKFLNSCGIHTFKQLHRFDKDNLMQLFNKEGKKVQLSKLNTWHHQAGMASRAEWNELKTYQNFTFQQPRTIKKVQPVPAKYLTKNPKPKRYNKGE